MSCNCFVLLAVNIHVYVYGTLDVQIYSLYILYTCLTVQFVLFALWHDALSGFKWINLNHLFVVIAACFSFFSCCASGVLRVAVAEAAMSVATAATTEAAAAAPAASYDKWVFHALNLPFYANIVARFSALLPLFMRCLPPPPTSTRPTQAVFTPHWLYIAFSPDK